MIKYDDYLALMHIAYPESTKRFLKGKTPKHIIVDTKESFSRLDVSLKKQLMNSLEDQIRTGKRSLPDRDKDDFIINKKGN